MVSLLYCYLYDYEPEKLTSSEILAEGKRFKVSISAGVVQCGENFQSWLDMVKEADRLMYEDKKKKAL